MSDPNVPLHVMAGVLRDAQGRVLLAQRPPGKHLAGQWEFPGGKREPGETPFAALHRELHEELGIRVDADDGVALIRIPWQYGERALLLDAWRVTRWQGEPASQEGQALRWLHPADVDPALLAPADRPILQALRLPARYAITPADAVLDDGEQWHAHIVAALASGTGLIQLRLPLWPITHVRDLAARLQPVLLQHDAQLLLNADIQGALALGGRVGVHLKATQPHGLRTRPLPWAQPVGVSCHNAHELADAVRIGADFATLSPVAPTVSHPHTTPLGWDRFHIKAEAAALPVYALGGVSPADDALARQHCGQGVAGIRAFW